MYPRARSFEQTVGQRESKHSLRTSYFRKLFEVQSRGADMRLWSVYFEKKVGQRETNMYLVLAF
jgi:hypothetical protein